MSAVSTVMCLLLSIAVSAAAAPVAPVDTSGTSGTGRMVHRIEADYATGGILHTNEFLAGHNHEGRVMNHSSAVGLKYAFMAPEGSLQAFIYKGAYQGVGMAFHHFNPQLGNPVSLFVFQGARIATPARRLSLNYEWKFGVTMGWNPYDEQANPDNKVIGSKSTACLSVGLYLSWQPAPWLDVNAGIGIAHYSNGNTSYPNAGLNTLSARLSAAYYVGRQTAVDGRRALPRFRRHVSYDLVVFGAWRRRGVELLDDGVMYAIPGTYGVAGLNFNPMYNVNHWFNAGLSIDAVYDHSANVFFEDGLIDARHLRLPPLRKQVAMGLSVRAEFVMPHFTINAGIGRNVIGAHGDFGGFYEVLALKVAVYRGSFLHIGYCLDRFRYPNYLMLGVGYRFNGKRSF